MIQLDAQLSIRAKNAAEFNASACINCGSCTAVCPMGVLPRLLFRHVLMGASRKVLESASSVYACLLCGMCESNCPAGVNIVENMRSLRHFINDSVYGLSRS
jgi:heterodisulfide reductase subunit C2